MGIDQRHHCSKYGPVLRIAPDEVTFANEEAWDDIFLTRSDGQQFLKDSTWWGGQPGQPPSILSAIDPEDHGRIRKLLAPAFTPRALRFQEPVIAKYVDLLTQRLRDVTRPNDDAKDPEAEVDVTTWFHFTTFEIFGDIGFGESFECLQTSKYHPWIALLFNSVKAASFVAAVRFYPVLQYLLMKCIPQSLINMQRKHYFQIVDKVDRRLNWELERPDIMSHVIDERKDDRGLPIETIYTTFMVLTTAGSETTASVLSGTVNYLVANPDKLEELTREIRQTFQNDNDITLEALRDLRYLTAVLNEGLRLCPPVPWMLPRRVPVGGCVVGGVFLPGGTRVSIQAYTLNRSSRYFYKPTEFVPERWLPDTTANPASPFFQDRRQAIQPFSVGPRNCMGQYLAWAEMRLVLAKLVWNFELASVSEKQIKWEDLRTFLLVEKKPIVVRIRPRKDHAG
ncbi:hypothetical protein N0V82_009498 [Gnomoniopsis sp. IMI 355080]|nr:hypothetical protein N0V82_009498 [Gnomoniopsis sp. IMI 355080]